MRGEEEERRLSVLALEVQNYHKKHLAKGWFFKMVKIKNEQNPIYFKMIHKLKLKDIKMKQSRKSTKENSKKCEAFLQKLE